jgi:DNA-binding MarR family transcriptional regulator
MAARNERKLKVLMFVLEAGELTSEEVCNFFEMEIHNARMQLQRYWKTGLLNRRVVDKKTKKRIYRISPKGKARLRWLENNDEPFSLGKMSCAYPRL